MSKQIGLYIHIPYCKRKCNYCSFYSKACPRVEDKLFSTLIEEIKAYKENKLTVDTIYIGGGTPSLLSVEQFNQLMSAVRDSFEIISDAEISVEINPESVTDDFLECLKNNRVNRVSFGVQTFIDSELAIIGRLHTSEQAYRAIKLASNYFNNINLDLMVGLPEQTLYTFKKTLYIASTLPLNHVSVYSLILEEGTPLFKMVESGLELPSEDDTVEMYDLAVETLKEKGFHRYEISNFANIGHECNHNLNCWQFREYIGIGPAAHSFFNNERYSNSEDIDLYINKESKIIYPDEENDRMKEYIMLSFRTSKGIDKQLFKKYFDCDFDETFSEVLEKADILKTCENTADYIRIKDDYIYVSNSIILEFLDILY